MDSLETRNTHFNIGVVGFLGEGSKSDLARVKITCALSTITERVLSKEYEHYNTPSQSVKFDFYTSPLLSGEFWSEFCQHWNMGELCVAVPESSTELTLRNSFYSCKTTVSSELKGVAQIHSMVDWVACQIDIAFALWDGNETSHNGSIWMFIDRCKQNGIPCIWIDTTDYEKSFWFRKIYPEPFTREVLWNHIDGFYIKDNLPESAERIQPEGYLFSELWARVSKTYERRHSIAPVFDETKTGTGHNSPSTLDAVQFEDTLLHHRSGQIMLERTDSNELEKDFEIRSNNFIFLREAFHQYEDAADRLSPSIRATLYCRTWAPLLSTIFLAVGFYVETIMRFLTGKQNFLMAGRWPVDTWAFIGGVGFLLSAYMLFYSRKNAAPHQANIKKFIVCRYVDEYFRIVLHFIAYGLPVSERILNRTIRNVGDPARQIGAIRVRRLLRMRTPSNMTVNAKSNVEMVRHLNEFFDTQIAYQTVGRKQRFEGILHSLDKWIPILLRVNLIMLALRAVLQFTAGLLPETLTADTAFYWLNYSNGGKNVVDFARSFANMAALMITAWYDKYLRQKDVNHYGGYSQIAEKVLAELHQFKNKTTEIASRQMKGDTVSYDWFRSLAEDTVESLTCELSWWCDETDRK